MSQEQFSGATVDARTDIFSLGATLYWMCTGEKPFAGDTLTAISFKVVYTSPIPARQLNVALPAALDAVFDRCMAKNPDDRYPTGAHLAADLEAVKAGRPVAARPIPAPSVGETIAVPVTKTVAISAAPRLEKSTVRETPAPSAGLWAWARALPRRLAVPSFFRGMRAKHKIAVAVLLALVVLAGGYRLWLGDEAESPAPEAAGTSPRPRAGGRAQRPEERTRPIASATLRVVCQHNFRSASLEVFVDDERLLDTTLRGHEQNLGVIRFFQGTMETSRPIAAGRHLLRVHVSSPGDGYEDEAEIGGTFSEGGSRTLLVEFGQGSALGVVNRRLTLSWR